MCISNSSFLTSFSVFFVVSSIIFSFTKLSYVSYKSLNPSILLNRGITKEMLRDEEGACEDWSKARKLGLQQGKTYYINNCE